MKGLESRLGALEAAQQHRAAEQRVQAEESPLPPHLRALKAEIEAEHRRNPPPPLPPHLRALLDDDTAS